MFGGEGLGGKREGRVLFIDFYRILMPEWWITG